MPPGVKPVTYAVPVTTARTSYHHGALREALMDACLRLIETEGIGAVSLRRVAREAGVSPGAPYHHFPDRAALLAAVSVRGFELLAQGMSAARTAADGPVAALTGMAHAYIGFATTRPGYFRLMFRPELSEPDRHPELVAAGDATLHILGEVIGEAVRAGLIAPGDADVIGVAFWSLGHGIASLWLDGKLDKQATALNTTAQALTDRIIDLVESLLLRQR